METQISDQFKAVGETRLSRSSGSTGAAKSLAAPRDAALTLLGVKVERLDRQEAIAKVLGMMAPGQPLQRLAFLNAHAANLASRDTMFSDALKRFKVLPDGVGVDLGARMVSGHAFPANLNGTDFVPELMARSPRPLRVMLLGAAPGVVEIAARNLQSMHPRHDFLVLSHGFFTAAEKPALLNQLAATKPDLLLVALGNPRQELFIANELDDSHARLAIGVGALFDFISGAVPRAPRLIRMLRLEWLFRLAIEPKRLFRRYVLGNPAFLARVFVQKLSRKRG
jgi:exopolysaccharide biosynthesis WecB/TagA/CpsF family protein